MKLILAEAKKYLKPNTNTSYYERKLDKIMAEYSQDFDKYGEILTMVSKKELPIEYVFVTILDKFRTMAANTTRHSLALFDMFLKTGSSIFRTLVTDIQFLEELHNMIFDLQPVDSSLVLNFIVILKFALMNYPEGKEVERFYNILQAEGNRFPPFDEKNAIIIPFSRVIEPPNWHYDKKCFICLSLFGIINREHHCRYCGKSVCAKCSPNRQVILEFNIREESRICNVCLGKLNKTETTKIDGFLIENTENTQSTAQSYVSDSVNKASNTSGTSFMTNEQLLTQESDDIAKAIELSLQEYNLKNQQPSNYSHQQPSNYSHQQPSNYSHQPPVLSNNNNLNNSSQISNIQNKTNLTKSYKSHNTVNHNVESDFKQKIKISNDFTIYENPENDESTFLDLFENNISMLQNRLTMIKSGSIRLSSDKITHTLFQTLLSMQIQLHDLQQKCSTERAKWEKELKRIDLIRESRSLLNEMKDKRREKILIQEEEARLLMRLQTEQKMELIRQQKKESEEYTKLLQKSLVESVEKKIHQNEISFTSDRSIEEDSHIYMMQPSLQLPKYQPPQPPHQMNINMESPSYTQHPASNAQNPYFYPNYTTQNPINFTREQQNYLNNNPVQHLPVNPDQNFYLNSSTNQQIQYNQNHQFIKEGISNQKENSFTQFGNNGINPPQFNQNLTQQNQNIPNNPIVPEMHIPMQQPYNNQYINGPPKFIPPIGLAPPPPYSQHPPMINPQMINQPIISTQGYAQKQDILLNVDSQEFPNATLQQNMQPQSNLLQFQQQNDLQEKGKNEFSVNQLFSEFPQNQQNNQMQLLGQSNPQTASLFSSDSVNPGKLSDNANKVISNPASQTTDNLIVFDPQNSSTSDTTPSQK